MSAVGGLSVILTELRLPHLILWMVSFEIKTQSLTRQHKYTDSPSSSENRSDGCQYVDRQDTSDGKSDWPRDVIRDSRLLVGLS